MKKCICFIMLLALMTSSCGTFIPGPRYKVTVDDFAFNYDGSAVFYLEDSYRFFPLLVRYREKRYLYLYDRQSRKHRFVAETDAFSVSQFGPYVLYSAPWKKRFVDRERIPDFYILNYKSGERQGYRMPDGFDDDYLSYGFSYVQWEKDASLSAYVNFRYSPGRRPSAWRKQRGKPDDWYTGTWKVRIEPGKEVTKAAPCEVSKLCEIPWAEIRRGKFISPEGKTDLAFSKYSGYLSFNSELAVVDRETGTEEHIVKENVLIGLAQASKYILIYLPSALLHKLGINYP